jgi:ribosomal protein S18 acetylase RimI-like enzyme
MSGAAHDRGNIEVRTASIDHLGDLATLFGRAFMSEPMMAWAFDGPDLEARLVEAYARYLEHLIPMGVVWEAAGGLGGMVLVSHDRLAEWEVATVDPSIGRLAPDGGAKHEAFWGWVTGQLPDEPAWQLDSLAVDASARGRGVGSALVRHGLARASAAGFATTIETGTSANVPMYEHLGFRLVKEADAPDGGPHVWFMRADT